MKEMIKNTGIMLAITLIAGLVLGFIYQITKEPIAEQNARKKQEACQEVFQDAASFEPVEVREPDAAAWTAEGYGDERVDEVMSALDDSGSLLGYVITVTTREGYGGDIQFAIGVKDDNTMNGISILTIAETAGLGMKADTDEFKSQFADKNVEKFEYTKNGATEDSQIDALSGATITTNAMVNGVNAGLCAFTYEKGGN